LALQLFYILMLQKKHIILAVILFFSFTQSAISQRLSAEKVKAKYLFEFPRYMIWPNDDEIEVMLIGLVRPTPKLAAEMKEVAKNGYDNGIKIEVLIFNRIDDIVFTQILYVDSLMNPQMQKILKKIGTSPTALVTENYREKKYIMLNFLESKGNVMFQVNFENLAAAKIEKYPQFSQLGGTEITTKALFEESEKNLESERKVVLTQKEEIQKQQKELDDQKQKIAIQNQEIQNQLNQIEIQKSELASIMVKTQALSSELNSKIETLNKQKEEIVSQQSQIDEQQKKVQIQTDFLKKQTEEINLGQERINQQKQDITNLSLTIAFQKYIIQIFIVFLSIILILSFFLFKAYRVKRRDNILLAKQKQEILQQTEELEIFNRELEKLSIVASETSSAVVIMDHNGNFEWINAGFTRLYGYTFQLLKNELDENIRNASNHPDIENIIDKCINQKKTVIYETFVTTRSGQEKWAQSTLSPILDVDGNLKKLILIDSDITKIKEAEAEIIKQNEKITAQARMLELSNFELEKLSLVASKTDNSVIIASPDGELEWVNDGFTRLLGVTFDEFKESYGSNLFDSSLNPNIREMVEEGVRDRKSITYTAKTITRRSRLIWIQTTLTPIFDNNDNLRKFIAIDADITKIKFAEEEIAKQKEKIIESILYASRIQSAVLPPEDMLAKILNDHFILFIPKDIVSGDFYWATQHGRQSVIVAADCTGHGVPGAFMSMMGITFLNEIVALFPEDKIYANLILNHLRNNVKKALRQTGKEGEAKDGMDISVCIIDHDNMKLQYAGANNAMILIRNHEVIEYQPDDMPIGIFYKERESFTNNIIDIQKDDCFYISSDGYADQFGGEKGRKFMIKRFKELILNTSHLPMEEQKEVFLQSFVNWKGAFRQIDDILVIGFRI